MADITYKEVFRLGAIRKGLQLMAMRTPNGIRYVRVEDITEEQFRAQYPVERMDPPSLARFLNELDPSFAAHGEPRALLDASDNVDWHLNPKAPTLHLDTSVHGAKDICHYCGGRRESHTDIVDGVPGHRINRPDMPQHGEWHPFKLYSWSEMQAMYREMDAKLGPIMHIPSVTRIDAVAWESPMITPVFEPIPAWKVLTPSWLRTFGATLRAWLRRKA